MKKNNKDLYFILLRYLSCLFVSFNGLFIFYFIFTPLTLYSVYFLIKIFYPTAIIQNTQIIFNNSNIKLIGACIAGSAYFLLYILNFTTPMNLKKRVLSLLYSFFLFFIINVLRIFIFSILFTNNFSLFNILHMVVWYGLSGIIVFIVWILTIKKFKVKNIPVYTDIKKLITNLKL